MRRENWADLMWQHIGSAESCVFEYGEHDCCRFVARWLDTAIDGADYLDRLSAKYSDEASAEAFIAEHGGIVPAVSTFLGEPARGWSSARRGDVVAVPTDRGLGVGICVGDTVAVASDGVAFVPLSVGSHTWRID